MIFYFYFLIEDEFGQVRFCLEYHSDKEYLRITIIDACNLPPMDADGKADPYVEVSLRPGQKKFSTTIKPHCLNPTFNETEELFLTPLEIENSDLILKVMDSDFPQTDELIGIIRLPLKSLDLTSDSKQYSCLLLHDKIRNKEELTALDAAKLNLRISKNENQLDKLRKQINEASTQLQKERNRTIELRNDNVELQIRNNSLQHELEERVAEQNEMEDRSMWSDPESDQKEESRLAKREQMMRPKSTSDCYLDKTRVWPSNLNEDHSSSGSQYSSVDSNLEASTYSMSKTISGTRHMECLQQLNSLRQRIAMEDQKISQLRNYIQALEPSKNKSGKGSIEVGLSFFPISSRLKISLLSGSKLHVINSDGHAIERRPNPYVKVKIFLRNASSYRSTSNSGSLNNLSRRDTIATCKKESVSKGQRGYRWTFKTKIAEDTITPAWNEHFEIDDVTEEDLPNMYIEMTVMDYYKLLTNKPLGQIRIGPGQHRDNQHWEEMLAHHGSLIVMTHILEDI